MKLGIVITHTDPETVFNTLRLALYSIEQGDEVKVFLSGKGVEIDQIDHPKFKKKPDEARRIDQQKNPDGAKRIDQQYLSEKT